MKEKRLIPSKANPGKRNDWDHEGFQSKWKRDQKERAHEDFRNKDRSSDQSESKEDDRNWDDSHFREKWASDQQQEPVSNEEPTTGNFHKKYQNRPKPESPQPLSHYAGFWRRFVALVIDSIIITVAVTIIGFVTGFIAIMNGFVFKSDGTLLNSILFGVVAFVGPLLYSILFESSAQQGTPGKILLNISVTDLDGNRISFGRAAGRTLCKTVSGLFLIGYIMAGFTKRKQALHDMMAGTFVVRAN